MKKNTKRDWVIAGMQALTEKGEEAIRIDFLCQRLQVSKGSFYHHFETIDTYINELMRFWEEENTTNIIQETEKEPTLEQKTEKLDAQVMEKEHYVEVVIRAWAVRNPIIKVYLDKIDKLRIGYLQKLYMENGFPEDKAFDFARIEYGSFVGMQHLFRDLPTQEKKRLSDIFHQLLKTNKL